MSSSLRSGITAATKPSRLASEPTLLIKSSSSDEVVLWLSDPAHYPEPTQSVELVETHISWVFLTDRFVYKLKKPVDLGFLNFGTEARRRDACQTETRLNRRLAPHVYLGEVAISRTEQGELAWGQAGEVVDWVVKMRRLAAGDALDRQIAAETLVLADFDRALNRLLEFFTRLPPVALPADSYLRRLETHIGDNLRELLDPRHALNENLIRRIHGAQRRWLQLHSDVLRARVCDGRLIEGHGDLRPEHIFFGNPPAVIDCLEFSQELREIDVLDELGFLAVELEHLGRSDLSSRIAERYPQTSADHFSAALWSFYRSYRACVRAKVAALRAAQVSGAAPDAKALQYLAQADSLAASLGPPLMIVVRGLSGSGKSTLAKALSESLDLEWLQTDAVRREMLGEGSGATYGAGIYRPEGKEAVYREALSRATKSLQHGLSVVIDATFLASRHLSEAAHIATQAGARLLIVECQCPREVARERISTRREAGDSISDARVEYLALQEQEIEGVPAELPQFAVDTRLLTSESLDLVLQQLRSAAADLQDFK